MLCAKEEGRGCGRRGVGVWRECGIFECSYRECQEHDNENPGEIAKKQ